MIRRDPLRVAVLASWRADGLDGLFDRDGSSEVVAGVVTEPGSSAASLLDRHRVPWMLRDLRGFCLRRRVPLSDLGARRTFDAQTAAWLQTFRPDLVVLCGYRYLLAEPLLTSWADRVINVHDGDLRLRGPDGAPRYPGLRAVRDAICGGKPETRCTVHVVTPEIDAGPPLVVSGPYPVCLPAYVRGNGEGIGTYIALHRERMIRDCWGPLLRTAVSLFCEDRVRVSGDACAFIDGCPTPLVLSTGTACQSSVLEVS